MLFLYVARRALAAFVASLAAVVAIFLVVDFAENASALRGPGWIGAALVLYANKAAVVAYQTTPAAMLLAAAVTASGLRRTREYVAMRSLGLGPWRVAIPVLAVAATVAIAVAAFDDVLVVDASARAEKIMAQHFHRYGTWQRWHERKRWFRGRDGRRIYHLRQAGPGGAFANVTVLELTPDFRLARRIDAERMWPSGDGGWRLESGEERSFGPAGQTGFSEFAERTYRFDEDPHAFSVLPGRPSQMHRATLFQQIQLRRQLGLPTAEYALEWQNKIAYPLAGIPAGLMALALALRRNRRGHLTAALVEAVGISLVFWGAQGIFWSLGLAGRLPPGAAAWTPDGLFLAAGAIGLRLSA